MTILYFKEIHCVVKMKTKVFNDKAMFHMGPPETLFWCIQIWSYRRRVCELLIIFEQVF